MRALADVMVQLFDLKLRRARKGAKLRLNEARKLLRRAKTVEPHVREQVKAGAELLREAVRGGKSAEITKTTERLHALLDKHLAKYRKPHWRESFESVAVAVLVALLLRSFVVEAFKIPSGSMIPTLAIGDQIFVNKYIYGVRIPFTSVRLVDFAMPERGEVAVFICPVPPNEDYIKRVIGLPGDEVEVRAGVVRINGEDVLRQRVGQKVFQDRAPTGEWTTFSADEYEEQIGNRSYTVLHDTSFPMTARDFGPARVPEGHVFMMGDNRDHSFDSRAWGVVPLSNILGRSLFVWWSWGKDGLQWSRLGEWIQ